MVQGRGPREAGLAVAPAELVIEDLGLPIGSRRICFWFNLRSLGVLLAVCLGEVFT